MFIVVFCSVCLGRQAELTLSKGLIRGTSQLHSKYKCKVWATKSIAQQHVESGTARPRQLAISDSLKLTFKVHYVLPGFQI